MTLALLRCFLSFHPTARKPDMEEQRQPGRRRRAMLGGVLAAVAVAVALPASGAFADGDSSGPEASGGVQSAPVQDQRDQGPRDRDCPEKRDGQGGSSGSEDAIEL
jgi:hypothetical protein